MKSLKVRSLSLETTIQDSSRLIWFIHIRKSRNNDFENLTFFRVFGPGTPSIDPSVSKPRWTFLNELTIAYNGNPKIVFFDPKNLKNYFLTVFESWRFKELKGQIPQIWDCYFRIPHSRLGLQSSLFNSLNLRYRKKPFGIKFYGQV